MGRIVAYSTRRRGQAEQYYCWEHTFRWTIRIRIPRWLQRLLGR